MLSVIIYLWLIQFLAESAVQPGHIIQASWWLLSPAQPSAGDGEEVLGGETHPALLVIGQFGFINIVIQTPHSYLSSRIVIIFYESDLLVLTKIFKILYRTLICVEMNDYPKYPYWCDNHSNIFPFLYITVERWIIYIFFICKNFFCATQN